MKMTITIEGEPIAIAHDHDAERTYVVSLSEGEKMKVEARTRLMVELVRIASGQGEWLQDRHDKPRVSGWEPYIDTIKQVSPTQWTIQVVYPYTD